MKTDQVKPMTPDEQTFHDGAMIFAMQGLLSSIGQHDVTKPEEIAHDAKLHADALLAARRARKTQPGYLSPEQAAAIREKEVK